jgi:WD40 repeat protein
MKNAVAKASASAAVGAVALSPDAKLVASGAWNGEVRVWSTGDGKEVATFNASPGFAAKTVEAKK